MSKPILRRYTNLPSTLHILQEKCLTLLSPNSWDDKNDAFFISTFKKRIKAKSVLALCFSQTRQTYHHWRVFSGESDGVCLEFDQAKLLKAIKKDDRFTGDSVKYRKIRNRRMKTLTKDELPFVKRYPYKDEKEFRILFIDEDEACDTKRIDIPLNCINRITLSPWMPRDLVEVVKQTIKSISGCQKLEVYRSTIIETETWKRYAKSVPR